MNPRPLVSTAGNPPTPDRARLTGATLALDRRSHAVRRDLADIALAGCVIAPHYASAVLMTCVAERAAILAEPCAGGSPASELLFGERFEAFECSDGWAWGRSVHDGYVGYLAADAVQPAGETATHRITARLALVFGAATIKSPVVARLPMSALVRADAEEGAFIHTAAGWLHTRHAAAAGSVEPDPVTVAERLLGTPYGWGGRSHVGVDCSGLVQVALTACGFACPRDTDQQRGTVGEGVTPSGPLRRGDLVYFPGHVGLMVDTTRLLHANAFWMSTVIEPLADVVARLRPHHAEPVLAVRRV